ncbi:envelope stress response membrane protein PspB [Candidatus Albibeggiatoa sp. nov. BB20]|uniref:envelope stress response membrane protein PspB n=1 Tax=Candidatus Albibeggiatoa sp. nov. BB20 TaxID=3162723 RepID=UPI003365A562
MATIVTNLSNIVVFFIVFIIPLWLFLHYTMRTKAAKLSSDDKARIEVLQQQAQQLAERVVILETILDEIVPDWKQQNED